MVEQVEEKKRKKGEIHNRKDTRLKLQAIYKEIQPCQTCVYVFALDL